MFYGSENPFHFKMYNGSFSIRFQDFEMNKYGKYNVRKKTDFIFYLYNNEGKILTSYMFEAQSLGNNLFRHVNINK